MKARKSLHSLCIFPILTAAILTLPSCMKEDEELQRRATTLETQLKEKTAELEAKTKALEQAQAAAKSTPSPAPDTSGELTKAREVIAKLQEQLAAAQKPPAGDSTPSKGPGGIDLDSMKQKLERDLTEKAAKLRDLVLQQTGVATIKATTTESIQYPPEVIAPFHSAISFTLPAADGQECVISFPVEADFSGTWSLPTPADIQKTYKMVREKFAERFAGTPNSPATPQQTPQQNGATAQASTPGQQPTADDWKNMVFVEVSPGVVAMRPRGSAANSAAQQSRPATPTTPPQTTQNTPARQTTRPAQPAPPPEPPQPFTFNGPGTGVTNPPSAAPQAPSQPGVNVPAPIMPVQRDVIIRWK